MHFPWKNLVFKRPEACERQYFFFSVEMLKFCFQILWLAMCNRTEAVQVLAVYWNCFDNGCLSAMCFCFTLKEISLGTQVFCYPQRHCTGLKRRSWCECQHPEFGPWGTCDTWEKICGSRICSAEQIRLFYLPVKQTWQASSGGIWACCSKIPEAETYRYFCYYDNFKCYAAVKVFKYALSFVLCMFLVQMIWNLSACLYICMPICLFFNLSLVYIFLMYMLMFIFSVMYSFGQPLSDDIKVYNFVTLTLWHLMTPAWGMVFVTLFAFSFVV